MERTADTSLLWPLSQGEREPRLNGNHAFPSVCADQEAASGKPLSLPEMMFWLDEAQCFGEDQVAKHDLPGSTAR
jgi:hypothetical protein